VVKNKSIKRFAFTLIELIFAIVIIGIAVISLPTMSQVSSRGIENALVQEGILLASLELHKATSGLWNENSLDTNSSYSKVINIAAIADCNETTRLRPGHIPQPGHRSCFDDNRSTISLNRGSSTTYNIYNALDPLNTPSVRVITDFASDADGYKTDYFKTVVIGQRAEGIQGLTDINITILNNGQVVTRLRTIAANIGEVTPYSMEY